MDKIDIRDYILRILNDNKSEVDNFNDAVFEQDFLKVAEFIVENLPIYVVMQQRELLYAFVSTMEFDIKHETYEEDIEYFLEQNSSI